LLKVRIHKLINKSIKGDAKARKTLYGQIAPMMLSVAYRYASSASDAEDIFQDSVLNFFEKLHQLRDADKIGGWAKQIVVHEAIRYYKKHKKLSFVDDATNKDVAIEDESSIYGQININEVLKVIQQLPEKMRLVINLYAIEGYKHEEIAEMLGISVGTSKSNLHDARKRMKRFMQEEQRKLG
tara:strand:+ start:3617 stop:4165 length:549 start_codon:yes stop_codon:yes gene_type:complete